VIDDGDQDDYILRNGRKQLRGGESPKATIDRRLYSDVPLTPGGSRGRSQPLRRPGDAPKSAHTARSSTGEFGGGEPNTPLENFEARTVMRREVYGPQDALDLLYKAATEKLVDPRGTTAEKLHHTDAVDLYSPSHKRTEDPSPGGRHSRVNSLQDTHQDHHMRDTSRKMDQGGYHSRQASRQAGATDQPIDPELIRRDPSTEPGYNEALKAWARFRFVRAGWFTAQEAIEYIE